MDKNGSILELAPFFEESNFTVDFKQSNSKKKNRSFIFDNNKLLYLALMNSLKDYMSKNNFDTALIGVSGGIDSALTATIAADAIGSNRQENLC